MVYFWTKYCFVGAIPDHLMTLGCCKDTCVEIKYSLSINYEKPNEKNLNYLYKSESGIKLKTSHSYFTQCILQMAVTNKLNTSYIFCQFL